MEIDNFFNIPVKIFILGTKIAFLGSMIDRVKIFILFWLLELIIYCKILLGSLTNEFYFFPNLF